MNSNESFGDTHCVGVQRGFAFSPAKLLQFNLYRRFCIPEL